MGKDRNNEDQRIRLAIGLGQPVSLNEPCKPGPFYVYVHRDNAGTVFYVGKGTEQRAYSLDRQPEWHEYVSMRSGGKFSVEILRDNISEDDALLMEDALMAQHATTIINRQNIHAPYAPAKMASYAEAARSYDHHLKRAIELVKKGALVEAFTEFENAYLVYFDVVKNSDYGLGARQQLSTAQFNFHPHRLADLYTKALAKAGRHRELIAFAERYFRDYGDASNPTEQALGKRMERARKAARHGHG
jgi:hypothetical protein